jgi:hypothetical protein
MAGLLYYLPGKTRGVKVDELRAAGLAHAFDAGRETCTAVEVRGGPDKATGVVVADHRRVPPAQIGYYADKQTWRRIPKSTAWVGFYAAERPTPSDLARDALLSTGYLVKLCDGQEWSIPVARGVLDGAGEGPLVCSMLPESTTIDDDGQWQAGGVLPQYAELWRIAERWWDCIVQSAAKAEDVEGDSPQVVFEFEELNDAALVALAANYHVDRAEVALLGLFDDRCTPAVLNALVDWPTVQAWIKKNGAGGAVADGSPTAGGPQDGGPDTDPP